MFEIGWLMVGAGLATATCLWWNHRKRSSEKAETPPLGQIDLSIEDIQRLEGEPLFVDLLLLARMANSLRFAHTAPLEVYDEGTPRASRQLNGAFFVQVAFAIEALDTLKKLNPHLHDQSVWQSEIVPLFRDREIQELDRDSVRDLRRKIVFHFEREAIEKGLGQVRRKAATLAAMRGRRRMDVHFPFADEVAVAFLVPSRGLDDAGFRSTVVPWLQRATDLSLRLAEAIERVVVDFARQLDLKGVWVDT